MWIHISAKESHFVNPSTVVQICFDADGKEIKTLHYLCRWIPCIERQQCEKVSKSWCDHIIPNDISYCIIFENHEIIDSPIYLIESICNIETGSVAADTELAYYSGDVIMRTIASQITGISIVGSTIFFWCGSKEISKLCVTGWSPVDSLTKGQ